MKSAWIKASAGALFGAAMAVSGAAFAHTNSSMDVIGGGIAHECAQRALAGEATAALVEICNAAIDNELMSREDEAKTYTNRAVVQLRRGMFAQSERDLAYAEKLMPTLGEVNINRGALLIRQRQFSAAITEIDRGIAKNPYEPEKAYYNRALAYELQGDMRAAYFDYRKASEINPKWPDPIRAMARFQVKRVGS